MLRNNTILLVLIANILMLGCTCDNSKVHMKKSNSGATIKEIQMTMKTYPFSDPNPVANIGKIYPYFRYDGFTSNAVEKSWKMVVLENDFIKIYISPEIGGKIWGAIEKSTGKEFLYFNDVVKFRDVAMRGPWTSGGIEYNFGDIGHSPTCATTVDYEIKENKDGSVSCFVGAIDLPSGTRWNTEVKLPNDKAFFETTVAWLNTKDVPCSYYHWMNASAKSSGNLEFLYPGKNVLGHGGEISDWPIDNGRNVNWYEQNDFGSYKAYHIINGYSNFIGGYYHDEDFGFGHCANYDEKPGKKVWIWGLSDEGMIWEDLLTDSKGQYIEYQIGKLFNQAAETSTLSPFKHREFTPYDSDIMKELWFPIVKTKGMVAASEYAVLNIERTEDSLTIYLSPLQNINENLTIKYNGESVVKKLKLKPLCLFKNSFYLNEDSELEIILGDGLLEYSSENHELVDRPNYENKEFNWKSAYGVFTMALELEKQRRYSEAQEEYLKCISIDPGFLPALNRISLGYYRKFEYDKALKFCNKALSIDTYDPEANYNYGIINKKLGNLINAKSGFSIATQSVSVRSAAYTELAKMFLPEHNYKKCIHYSNKALESNMNNISALMMLAYANRKVNNNSEVSLAIKKIYDLDRLSDFALYEEVLSKKKKISDFNSKIKNELAYESYLDLALTYIQYNDIDAAVSVLKESPKYPICDLYLSYFLGDDNYLNKGLKESTGMVFPHRTKTAEILEELIKKDSNWKLKYYLGLIYWNKGLLNETKELFMQCDNNPDISAFYISKARLFKGENNIVKEALLKAYKINADDWRAGMDLANFYVSVKEAEKAITITERLIKSNPENSVLGICYANSLYADKKYEKCLDFLADFKILPNEICLEGKEIFRNTCVKLAFEYLDEKNYEETIKYAENAKNWPINLGSGRPFDIDDRMEDYIIACTYAQKGDYSYFAKVSDYKLPSYLNESSKLIFQLIAFRKQGKVKEAKILLNKLIEKYPDNNYIKWVKARYEKNPYYKFLQKEILKSDMNVGDFDTKFVDYDFSIVLEVLDKLPN